MTVRKLIFSTLFLCITKTFCYAQHKDLTVINISKKITFCVNKIQALRSSNHSEEVVSFSDSLENYNNTLTKYLQSSLQNPKRANVIDRTLNESIIMEKHSDDNKLSLFMWNSQMGGAQEQYVVIAQIKYSSINYKTILLNSSGSESDTFNLLYEQIKTIDVNGESYYLIIGSQKKSEFIIKKSLQVLHINNNLINDSKNLISDSKGGMYKNLSFQFDINKTKREPNFHINLKKKIFSMPTRNGLKYFHLIAK